MKKNATTLAALIVLATGSACAQSSLTVFGIVDASLTHGSGSVANRTQLSSGNLAGSRIGFRGTEDLSGGLKANFWLEAGLTLDDGQGAATNSNNQASGAGAATAGRQGLTFNRISYVSLSSSTWGEVRLGRDYTPTFNGHVSYDPANFNGVATSQTALGSMTIFAAPNGARGSNSIQYQLPNLNGFAGQFMYALGENPSNSSATTKDGNYTGARLYYTGGPLSASVAAANYKLSTVGDMKETVLGASYVIGQAKLWAIHLKNTTGTSTSVTGSMLGVTYTTGPTLLKASWSRSAMKSNAGAAIGTTDKLAFGAVYNLSTRTALYATAARTRNRDGAAALPYIGVAVTGANQGSTAYDIGIRHVF